MDSSKLVTHVGFAGNYFQLLLVFVFVFLFLLPLHVLSVLLLVKIPYHCPCDLISQKKKKITLSRVETRKNAHIRGERKRGPRGSFILRIADTNIIKNYTILLLIILTIISFPHSGRKEMLCGNCNGAGFLGGFMSTIDE